MPVCHEGLRVRLDPNHVQAGFLSGCGGAARAAYNFALEQIRHRQDEFSAARAAGVDKQLLPRPLSAVDIQQRWHAVKDERYPWHGQYPSKLYLFAFRAAVGAHQKWMKGEAGFPKFKRYGSRAAFRVCETVELRAGGLLLPKLGEVRIAAPDSRQAEARRLVRRGRARVVSATISRDACGTWWASLTIERQTTWTPEDPTAHSDKQVVGVDLGVKTLAVAATSTGTVVHSAPPRRGVERSERKLRLAQRALSRKDRSYGKATGAARPVKSKSKRRAKARHRLARLHRRTANQRAGHLHTLSKTLAATWATIVVEDLNVKGMTAQGGARKKGLNRRIREAGFGELRRQLVYKAGEDRIMIADRFYPSSKTCSACHAVNDDLTLADRAWTCPACHTQHDRDINAAVNLAVWGETRKQGETQAGDPDRSGPVSRHSPARPQRGTPRRKAKSRPAPERPRSATVTAGTRQQPDRGASALDGPGQGPHASAHIHAKRG